MNNNFHKLGINLNIGWDNIDAVLNSITREFTNTVDSYEALMAPVDGTYWQYYPYTHTRFTRKFATTFKQEAILIVKCLEQLQLSAKKEDFDNLDMYDCLVNHKFDYTRVQLIKSVAGVDTLPHIDNGRKYVINIGLKNSNTCTTYVSNSSDKTEFWLQKPSSFIMQDNEAYLINVDKVHAVKSHTNLSSKLDRYLVTYMLSEPNTKN